jgi:DNA polymerase-1
MTDPVFLDFETAAIGPRPHEYPPEPCGLAILDRVNGVSEYKAWGHPCENNSSREEATAYLANLLASGRPVCFHNAAFDAAVIKERLGLPWPAAMHDTMVGAFLHDPYVESLSLKPLAKMWCGESTEERDDLFTWIMANVPGAKAREAGAHISKAPGGLVGRYASADVRLTAALFDYTAPSRNSMLEAYTREIDLLQVLNDNSSRGIRVDRDALAKALEKSLSDIDELTKWLNVYFGSESINFGSGMQLIKALESKGLDLTGWPLSEKGTPRTDKYTLERFIPDQELVAVLRFRDSLSKLSGTYIEPWLVQSSSSGRIYTEWNSVRGERGGTRTGRLSGKPTLQTIPHREPKNTLPIGLRHVEIPHLREMWLPDEGHLLAGADFNSQELRLFAYFEGGQLAQQYRADPRADLHAFGAQKMSEVSGRTIIRDHAKWAVFLMLYGGGPKKLAGMMQVPEDDARFIIDTYTSAVATGLPDLNRTMAIRYSQHRPFRTLGGRLVKGEPPKMIQGKLRKFDYKMINGLVQGSAADQTKQAMLDYYRSASPDGSRIWLQMHDELVISAPADRINEEAEKLVHAMTHAFEMDVPFVADVKIGSSYAELK